MVSLDKPALSSVLNGPDNKPSLLLFSALGSPPFRNIKLRSRKPTCPACGTSDQKIGQIKEIDYDQFCGGATPDWESRGLTPGDPNNRISVKVFLFLNASTLS
jgi:adenylyltransferase/sulfurtransferase